MKSTVIVIAFALWLAGCDREPTTPALQPLDNGQAEEARLAVRELVGNEGRILFICGQSDGLGLFVDEFSGGFQPDGMKDGRLVFMSGPGDGVDVVFRDASGAYTSAVKDGGDVRRLSGQDQMAESWVIAYPSTGVTETHNITRLPEGRLVDLWTSNKPPTVLGASAKLFRAECVRA